MVASAVASKNKIASGSAETNVKVAVSKVATAGPPADRAAVADTTVNAQQKTVQPGTVPSPETRLTTHNRRYQLGAPYTPKPKYPRIAVNRRWQGEVLIAMQVKADGTPARVTVEKCSGYAVLDNSALKVLAKWRLAPSAEALETLYIPIIFRL